MVSFDKSTDTSKRWQSYHSQACASYTVNEMDYWRPPALSLFPTLTFCHKKLPIQNIFKLLKTLKLFQNLNTIHLNKKIFNRPTAQSLLTEN